MIINKTKEFLTLDVVGPNGEKDSVNLQPQGRLDLPEGYTLSEDKLNFYKTLITIS